MASPAWRWVDLYDDCSHTVNGDGIVIHASNYYRDLWFNNVSAPRLLHTVHGDLAVEVHCAQAFADRPALGGLVLWANDRNFLRLDWNIDGPGSVSLRGSIDGQDRLLGRGLLPVEDSIVLRMERLGDRVHALCSADGESWSGVAQVNFAVGNPIEVGPFASGMIHRYVYAGAYTEGSAIRFTSIRLLAASTTAVKDLLNEEDSE